ncbi:MAG: GTP diphosphokinase, partial [Psychromonas sp.]|nr:GTP diphosphokinase [Psychromonas sp.]
KLKLSDVSPAIKRFNVNSDDDIFAGIGNGDLRLNQLVHFLDDHHHQKTLEQQDIAAIEALEKRKQSFPPKSTGNNVIIDGVGNLMHTMARCCQAIPGESIEGYITQGRGISVHRKLCEQLADLRDAHPERIIEASWGESHSSGYSLTLRIEALDRSGLLKDITTLLSSEKVNVLGVNSMYKKKKQSATIDLNLEVYNSENIGKLVTKLSQLKDVSGVRRL